ncbi:GAF domain-containing sensor histidine kinase [candidate division KSB1 bacterium]|nr:MAG: GAF domain-containing sensor histidine kinase [candidate division KSB1 bacterium]
MPDDFFDELDDLTSGTTPEPTDYTVEGVEIGLQKLASLVEDVNRDLTTSTILDRIMNATFELTGAERGFLVLVSEHGEWNFRVARNMETGAIEDAENAASHTIIRKVLEGRRPILINDVVGASDLTKQQSIARMQVRSIMGAPLISKGKLIGAAYVDTSRLAGVFDQTSLVLFESFVQLAAVALENARLIEAEQKASTRYRELQEYLDTILDSQPHGVIILDRRLHIDYVSAQASTLLNGTPLRRGTPFANSGCCDGETMLIILQNLQEFLQQGGNRRAVFGLGDRTLAYSFFRVSHLSGDERVGMILEDVTLQKQLERKLIESEKQSTINQLAGGIAHEINNSLQPVKGRVELLALRLKNMGVPLADGVEKDLDTISALSERIEKIALDLKHLTKPVKSAFVSLDMGELIRSTVEMMESTTGTLKGFSRDSGNRGYKLEVDIGENLPPVLGDAHGLESAIINMILNSAHAIREKGQGTLTVNVHTEGEAVEVLIRDTGGGIHPDVLPRVFQPYFTTRGNAGGTGLGMCIVQNVAENHGARLELKSQFGEGTEIRLTFPTAKETAEIEA